MLGKSLALNRAARGVAWLIVGGQTGKAASEMKHKDDNTTVLFGNSSCQLPDIGGKKSIAHRFLLEDSVDHAVPVEDEKQHEMAMCLESAFKVSKMRNQLETKPISDIEAEAAIEVLSTNSQIVDAVLTNFSHHHDIDMTAVLHQVQRVITNQQLLLATCDRIHSKAKQKTSLESNLCISAPPNPAAGFWADLQAKFPCSICLDVCSAPHVLSCHHTFCWACLQDLKQSCISEDKSVETVQICPECRSEIGEAIYELRYDRLIVEAVQKHPDCEEKRNWEDKYKKFADQKNGLKKNLDFATFADDSLDDDDWSWFEDAVTVVMLFTVVALVVATRAFSRK